MTSIPTTPEERFLAALLEPAAEIESALHQMIAMRRLDDAVGVHLETIGDLVGQDREGFDDDTYRRLIRARIAANRSDGTLDDLIRVATLVVWDDDARFWADHLIGAELVFRVEGVALSDAIAGVLLRLLRIAVGAAIRLVLEWWTDDDEDALFTFDGESDGTAFPDTDGVGGGELIEARST